MPYSNSTVTIPPHTQVLLSDSAGSSSDMPFGLIIVPESSSLVFADKEIELHVSVIRVHGALYAGSKTCRLEGPLRIVFHNTKIPLSDSSSSSKGLVVDGGVAEIHGRLFWPTWTRLSTTAYAGDDWIELQDAVGLSPNNRVHGWRVGMSIVITTTTFDDIEHTKQQQNEQRRIVTISSNGRSLQLDAPLRFRHHGGHEYQAEVGLLSRTIIIDGGGNNDDLANHIGGHTIVTGGANAAGRFSGIEAVRMGQKNVRGRYPFHWHLLGLENDGSQVVEAGAFGSTLLPTDAWASIVPKATHRFWMAGSDNSFYRSSQGRATASFAFVIETAGKYDILISQPPNSASATGLAMYRGFGLTSSVNLNVTYTSAGGNMTIQLSSVYIDQRENDPVDVLKQWNLALEGVVIEAPGDVVVTLALGDSANDGMSAVAVDAVWLRESPQGKNYLTDSSIHDSHYRCVSIHGTSDVSVVGNVAFNVFGHCYYLEDGVEERNTLAHNLAAHIRTIGRPAAGGGQTGEVFYESEKLRNPSDSAAAGFYITNARNWIYSNAASGGWTGYSFPNLPLPVGAFRGFDFGWFNPQSRLELQFDGNTAHSAGISWVKGNCLYVGGKLTHGKSGDLRYHTGRNARYSYNKDLSRGHNSFSNVKVFLCRRGVNHWGENAEIHRYEAHDVMQGAVIFGSAYLHDGLIQATTTNRETGIKSRLGFQFYDTRTQTILNNLTFRGYVRINGTAKYTNAVFSPMDHSDTFKPQGISAVQNIHFEGTDRSVVLDFPMEDSGASYMYNIVDFGGSLSGRGHTAIIGSHSNWWDLGCDCGIDKDFNVWVCDHGGAEGRDIGSVALKAPGLTRSDYEKSHIETRRHIGYVCQYSIGHSLTASALEGAGDMDSHLHNCMILTKNPVTTGVTNRIWFWRFFGGGAHSESSTHGVSGIVSSPAAFEISHLQIPPGRFIVFALLYPKDTTGIHVNLYSKRYGGNRVPVPELHSLKEILDPVENLMTKPSIDMCTSSGQRGSLCNVSSTGPAYFWDGDTGVLYLRLVDAGWHWSRLLRGGKMFKRDGAWINGINTLIQYEVAVNCSRIPGTLMCSIPNRRMPAAARPSGSSCSTATSRKILPARIDLRNSVSPGAWKLNKRLPVTLVAPNAGTVLFLSATSGDFWQFSDETTYMKCDFTDAVLLFKFSKTEPALDVILPSIGTYYFATQTNKACKKGLKMQVRVGLTSSAAAPAALLGPQKTSSPHATCASSKARPIWGETCHKGPTTTTAAKTTPLVTTTTTSKLMPLKTTTKHIVECPKTCDGETCDYWVSEESFECKMLEMEYGCDCTGCECKVDKMLAACGQYKYKGDGNCDDDNNNADCEFDGGDCCAKSLGGPVKKDYCKECKCLDPNP